MYPPVSCLFFNKTCVEKSLPQAKGQSFYLGKVVFLFAKSAFSKNLHMLAYQVQRT